MGLSQSTMFCSFSLCLGKIVTNFLPWMAASNTREWQCTLAVHKPSDLPLEDQELLRAAHEAAAKAYAPYSNFQVGGAVRLADGVIVKGSNQENMAYPSGMCGERVAVFAAGAQHPGQTMTTLAIVSPSMRRFQRRSCLVAGVVRCWLKQSDAKKRHCAFCFRSATKK